MMADTTDFISEARTKCAMSIRNTAVGDWLGEALRRLEKSGAENERLREALEKIANEENYGLAGDWGDPKDSVWDVARQALEGGQPT